ncbi:hypothetical protein TVAG_247990 [Trichomonas vaginalis G3]|uniref:Uncharacterized protein n=1 Tax=Trichomonas vaginalis (strain ATCC PRA-98 / G3) TaxID=412133 RepID=A2FRF4_TRIV3|nr:hypothetical protein TVAGG3_0042390 [Trichomonas vaginalis G3]EAX92518.1 hypothetical protein TVAG_247990 [Trichomonas vaginalis G3]KAI5540785.1 hypothetical protein TVAGG3_0042390 [Trichomonas vaginalis G3]|eukprot:XP_001305448.1 hypothetical protein [Trichomonas vaginalis G3]
MGGNKEIFRICQSINIDFSQILQFAYAFRNDELYDYLSDFYPDNKVKGLTGTIRCILFASQFPQEADISQFLVNCAVDGYNSIFNHITNIKILFGVINSIYDDNVIHKILENNTIPNLIQYIRNINLLLQIVKTEKFYYALINDPESIKFSYAFRGHKSQLVNAIKESLDEDRYVKLNEIAAKNEILLIFDPDFAFQFLSSGKFTDQSTLNFLVDNIDISKIDTVDKLINIFFYYQKWSVFYEIMKNEISDETKLKLMDLFYPENTKKGDFDRSSQQLHKICEFFFASPNVRKMAKLLHILYFAFIFNSSTVYPIYFEDCLKEQNIPLAKRSKLLENIIKSNVFQNTTIVDETIDSFTYIPELSLFYETKELNKEQFLRLSQLAFSNSPHYKFLSDEKYMKYYDFDQMPISFFRNYGTFNKEMIDYLVKVGKLESFAHIPGVQKFIDFDQFLNLNLDDKLKYFENHIFEKSESERVEEFFRNRSPFLLPYLIQRKSQVISILNPKIFIDLLDFNRILTDNYSFLMESIYINWPDETIPQNVANYFLMFPHISYKIVSNQIERISIFPISLQILFPLICNLYSSNEIFERMITENKNKYKDFLIDTIDFINLCNALKMSEVIKFVVENYKLDKIAVYYGISRLIVYKDLPTVEYLMKKFNYNYDYVLLNKLTIPQMIDIHIYEKQIKKELPPFDVCSDYNILTPQVRSVLKSINGFHLEEYFVSESLFLKFLNWLDNEKLNVKVASCILLYTIDQRLISKIDLRQTIYKDKTDDEFAAIMKKNYQLIFEALKKQNFDDLQAIDDIINGKSISVENFTPYDQFYLLACMYDNVDAMKQLLSKRNYMDVEINKYMKSPIILSIIDHKFEIFKLLVSNIPDPINAIFRDMTLIYASINYAFQQGFDYLLENNLYNLIPNNYCDPFTNALRLNNPYYALKLEKLIDLEAEKIANPDCISLIKHLHGENVELTNIGRFIRACDNGYVIE